MKINFYAAALWGLMVFLGCRQAPSSSADEAMIKDLMLAGVPAAWEKNDLQWIKDHYLADADIAFPSGPLFQGIENLHQSSGPIPSGRKFQVKLHSMRFITPDVALVNNEAHFSSGTDGNGLKIPDARDMGSYILKKSGDQWKIAALRVMPMRMDRAEVEKAITENWQLFSQAFQNGNALAVANMFTEDAINSFPGRAADTGRIAIQKITEQNLKLFSILKLDFTTAELHILGDHAFVSGTFEQQLKDDRGKQLPLQKGHYSAVWRYDYDELWRIKNFLCNFYQ